MPLAGGPVRTEAEDAIHPVMTKRGLYAQSIGKSTGDNKGLPAATGIGPVKSGRVQPVIWMPGATGYELGASVSPDGRYVSLPLGDSLLPEDQSTVATGLTVDVQSKKASVLSVKKPATGGGFAMGAADGFVVWRTGENVSYVRADRSLAFKLNGSDAASSIPLMVHGQADGSTRLLAPSAAKLPATPGWTARLP